MIDKFNGKYRWLSNFWLVSVEFEGVIYPSTENAYQAAKIPTRYDGRDKFITCSPSVAKNLGNKVSLQDNWDNVKLDVMHTLIANKFKYGSYLAGKLVATGDKEIIEGNHWGDVFWGVCNGVGENHLGNILMDHRSKLQIMDSDYYWLESHA